MKDSQSKDDYGKNVQKTFQGRKLDSKEKLLVKVTNLSKLAQEQERQLEKAWKHIDEMEEKVKEFDNMKRQKRMWERKYHDLSHEFSKWKKIKFGK
jgi:hypothetical protein